MGAERVHDRVRRRAHPGGQAGRPGRAPARVPDRLDRLHRRLDGLRPGPHGRAADRVPHRPGRRRRRADPVVVGVGDARLRQRPAAPRRGHLGCGRCRRRSPRTHAGRGDRRGTRLALGVLHQPPRRHLHRGGRAPEPARVLRPGDPDPLPPRRRPHRRRGRPALLRRRRVRGARVAQRPDPRRPRRRPGRPRPLRAAPATHQRAGPRSRAVPDQELPVGERRHVGVRHRVRRPVPGVDPLPHPGVGVVGAPGRLRRRTRSDHGRHRRPPGRQARRTHRTTTDPHHRRRSCTQAAACTAS